MGGDGQPVPSAKGGSAAPAGCARGEQHAAGEQIPPTGSELNLFFPLPLKILNLVLILVISLIFRLLLPCFPGAAGAERQREGGSTELSSRPPSRLAGARADQPSKVPVGLAGVPSRNSARNASQTPQLCWKVKAGGSATNPALC